MSEHPFLKPPTTLDGALMLVEASAALVRAAHEMAFASQTTWEDLGVPRRAGFDLRLIPTPAYLALDRAIELLQADVAVAVDMGETGGNDG